jgi:hypothetical protein
MIDNETNTATEDETMSARQRAIEAYESAGRRAKDRLSEAPFIALAGGIAAGALIAALLPRTQSEARLVRPTARRVKDTAKAAYKAARETGEKQLGDLGLSREKGEETIRSLFKGVTDAAKASAEAALDTARTKR